MLRLLFAIGAVGFEVEAAVDVSSDEHGQMWKIHRPTGRHRFRVLGVPMPWRAR